MLYKVLVDGISILDYDIPSLTLIRPEVTMEVDTAGTFIFTVPYEHQYYDMFDPTTIMALTIEVWEGDTLHWFGRPIEMALDFDKNKEITCEGALGYFNDTVIEEEEFEDTQMSLIFAYVLACHNSIAPYNRQFQVGEITVNDKSVYRKFDYDQCYDALKSKFLDAEDGHFFVRRENGVNYLDFLENFPYTTNQNVVFGENLLDMSYTFDSKDFATCVIPLGGNDEETNTPITIASINDGSPILVGSSANNYGKIVKVQRYGDIKNPYELKEEGQKYLRTIQYNAYLLECTAIDKHSMDNSIQPFRVGQTVTCISEPHGITQELPISKMVIHLDQAKKEITLGRIPKKTLARFYKTNVDNGDRDFLHGGGGDNWWDVVKDPDSGDPTVIKVPIRLKIDHLPNKTSYREGETFTPAGIVVKLVASSVPLEYFVDERYPDSIIPLNELTFTDEDNNPLTTISQKKAKIKVVVHWISPYNGRKLVDSFVIINESQQAIDDAEKPVRIVVAKQPNKLEYYNGALISLNGAKIVAYTESGQVYEADGYRAGVVPNSELKLIPAHANKDSGSTIKKYIYDGHKIYTSTVASWSYHYAGRPYDDYDTVTSSGLLVAYGSVLYVFSKSQGTSASGNWISGSTGTGNPYTFSAHIRESYRIDGEEKVFYHGAGGHTYCSTDSENITRWSGTLPVSDAIGLGEIARILFESEDPTEVTTIQEIQIEWETPYGDTLTTSFEITVKDTGGGGGR